MKMKPFTLTILVVLALCLFIVAGYELYNHFGSRDFSSAKIGMSENALVKELGEPFSKVDTNDERFSTYIQYAKMKPDEIKVIYLYSAGGIDSEFYAYFDKNGTLVKTLHGGS